MTFFVQVSKYLRGLERMRELHLELAFVIDGEDPGHRDADRAVSPHVLVKVRERSVRGHNKVITLT